MGFLRGQVDFLANLEGAPDLQARPLTLENAGGFGVHSPPVFWRLQEGNHPKRVCDSVIHPNLNGPYGI